MFRKLRILAFSCAFFLLAEVSKAQTKSEEDSTTITFLKSALYIDYGKLLTSFLKTEAKYEGGVELLFIESIAVLVEYGGADLRPTLAYPEGDYLSSGKYQRIGLGYHFPFSARNTLGISVRYGQSRFDETILTNFETSGIRIERQGLQARWAEVVFYSDKEMNRWLSLGINLRLRVLIDYEEFATHDVYSIPGYGRSFDKRIPAINIFAKINLFSF